MTQLDPIRARKLITEVREKLREGTAEPRDHLEVLEALLVLPTEEAEPMLSEFRRQFAVVVARHRQAQREAGELPEVREPTYTEALLGRESEAG